MHKADQLGNWEQHFEFPIAAFDILSTVKNCLGGLRMMVIVWDLFNPLTFFFLYQPTKAVATNDSIFNFKSFSFQCCKEYNRK